MPSELVAQVFFNNGLHFTGTATSGHNVQLDATAPHGEGKGFAPMELVLISLASCSAMDVLSILRKKRQQVHSIQVRARGVRQDGHPTVFTNIALEFIVWGSEIDPSAVERAIGLAEELYCPVWALLKPTVQITASFEIMAEEPLPVD